jgi:hypothetical protein
LQPWTNPEAKQSRRRSQSGACFIGVLGFGWGIYTTNQSRSDAPKRPAFEKELEACIELNKSARDIVDAKEKKDIKAARKAVESFKSVFDGPIMVAGDTSVVTAATHFQNCSSAQTCMFLRQMATNLTNACRTSVVGSVNATLPPISPPTITGVECGPNCKVTPFGGNMVQVEVK